MPPQRVLIIGDCEQSDFKPAVRWLRGRAETFCAGNVDAAVEYLFASPPELVLFAQARPGQFSQGDVERLHAAAPLARLAVLLGTWCEGELRTGDPLDGVVRIAWHEWEAKLAPLWETPEEAAAWRLPRTAVAGERTLAASPLSPSEERLLIAIRALSAASYDSLSSACRAAGYLTAWLDPRQPARAQPASLLLWEGDVRQEAELEELSRLAKVFQPAPTIALLNFPRQEDGRLVVAAGAAGFVAKPFLVSDLARKIRALCHDAA